MPETRTRTGLLEGYLEKANEIERLARARRAGAEPMTVDESQIVLQVLQHSVGLQRAIEKLIAVHVARERRGPVAAAGG